jgi:mono/diheme cytochrome c family protein
MNCSPPRDIALFFAVVLVGSFATAARAQEKPLPPAANQTVDFTQDIQPIIQNSCLRCHGPEKPRSHFRLDNRASALAGGNSNTNDIVPGDSANSRLIHYTSYVEKDMEMPPVGKGDRLTRHQIGLLRAWIDQGANWGTNRQTNSTTVTLATTAGGFDVQGNKAKFRELEGVTDGFSGGLEKFSLTQKLGPDEKFSLDGHLLEPQQDFGLKLALDKTDLGFVHAGFEQWRKYYSTDGGYDPAVTPP